MDSGLPVTTPGHRVALVHRDRVHEPGHDLGVGPDVGRGDVAVRPDDRLQLGREPAGHGLQLLGAHRARIARHAALRAAERHVDERALPGHPHREGADVVQVGLGVEPQPALGRAAGDVVLDAEAGEHADRSVVELHRELDDELALGDPEDLAQAGLDVEVRGGGVVLGLGGSERAGARGGGRRLGVARAQGSSMVIGAPWTAAVGSQRLARAGTKPVDERERAVNTAALRVHAPFTRRPGGAVETRFVSCRVAILGRMAPTAAEPAGVPERASRDPLLRAAIELVPPSATAPRARRSDCAPRASPRCPGSRPPCWTISPGSVSSG